jgi:ribosomal protein L6P/L9E
MTTITKSIFFEGSVINCFFDVYKSVIIIKGRLGRVVMPIDKKIMVLINKNHDNKLNIKLFLRKYTKFYSIFERHLRGVTFGWFISLNLIGIQYIMKYSRRFRYLKFSLGYNSLIKYKVRRNIYVYKNRRNLFLYGWDFNKVFGIARFLRTIKCLEPYKIKGFIYEGEKIKLKPGKRQKK